MQTKIFAVVSAVLILTFVLDLIRRQKMTFRYSVVWLIISFLSIFFALYDRPLYQLAKLAGFTLPSNFIFFLFLIFFIWVCLFLTLYVNEQSNRSETLAQSVAILEHKLKQLEARLLNRNKDKSP